MFERTEALFHAVVPFSVFLILIYISSQAKA